MQKGKKYIIIIIIIIKTMDPFSSMPLNDKLHPVAFFEAFPNATKLPWDESRRIFSFDYKVQYIMV